MPVCLHDYLWRFPATPHPIDLIAQRFQLVATPTARRAWGRVVGPNPAENT